MKFLIVSNAPIIEKKEDSFAYSPYVKEMEIWAKYTDEVAFCCPQWRNENGLFVSKIPFKIHKKFWLSDFDVTSFKTILKSLFQIPFNFWILFKAMIWADHIHLRCPGNVGLLASIIQVFFPWKKKTVKYAGNWDPQAKQPWSYKLQRKIISNTFLSRSMQVLVYGTWENQSKNIKPFFTATYKTEETEKAITQRDFKHSINFLFVGTLSGGKRPLYAIQLVQKLHESGFNVNLDILGEGKKRDKIKEYCIANNLNSFITMHGNKELDFVKELYRTSHFLILPSKSEGWPKVVAEAMFWGCVPLSTAISCVPFMLDKGERGCILSLELDEDVQQVITLLNDTANYQKMSKNASDWSRKYTTDYFESEIAKLLL